MRAAVGADIHALCNKCGPVWHVVVAKVGGNIVKVECKECHGTHRYRDPEGKRIPAARKTGTAAGSRAKRTAVSAEIQPNMDKPVQPYRASERFESGDRVAHSKFGLGVAQHSPAPGKIQVLFADGPRLLVMARGTQAS